MAARTPGIHMSLPNPPSTTRSAPVRGSTATAVPPFEPSGLDAFSSADEEVDWSQPTGSALDKFSPESDAPARRAPVTSAPPTVSRSASSPQQHAGSGPQTHIAPVAVHQTYRSQRPSALDADAIAASASGTRLLPVRPRAPLMDNATRDADSGAAGLIARAPVARAQAVDLPAAIPVPSVPLRDRLRNVSDPYLRTVSDAMDRALARTSTYRAPSFLVSALIVVGALELALLGWYAVAGFGGPSGTVTITSTPIGAEILI